MNAVFANSVPSAEPPPGVSISAIAEVGALVSDPARTNMLVALFGGNDLTARELADRAGVTPQTASGHLSKLIAAGLIRMRRVGRYHYHSLASSEIVLLIQALHVAGHSLNGRATCQRADHSSGFAAPVRRCRGHLAGSLATSLAQALAEETGEGWRLTGAGRERLVRWGLDRRLLDPPCAVLDMCLDWTEHRAHLSGRLGAAFMERAMRIGWLKIVGNASFLQLTPLGLKGFKERFAVEPMRHGEASACAHPEHQVSGAISS